MGQKASEFKFERMLGSLAWRLKVTTTLEPIMKLCTSAMWKLAAHETLDGGLFSEVGDILCPAVKPFGLRNI